MSGQAGLPAEDRNSRWIGRDAETPFTPGPVGAGPSTRTTAFSAALLSATSDASTRPFCKSGILSGLWSVKCKDELSATGRYGGVRGVVGWGNLLQEKHFYFGTRTEASIHCNLQAGMHRQPILPIPRSRSKATSHT